MKLLYTIHQIIQEAEDNLYIATLKSDNTKEVEVLEKKLSDSLELLEIYNKL